MDEENYQVLRDYSLKLLSLRPRSIKEIRQKLQSYSEKKKIEEKLIEQVIYYLTEKKFLDDREFIKWWIDQRQSFRPKGLKLIKLELLAKGIDGELIDSVLTGTDTESINEYDLAMRIIEKKMLFLGKVPSAKLRIKIRDILWRRGFDWNTIRKVIDTCCKKS